MILLEADVLELKANPTRNAKGRIVEAQLDRGRGPVATVLVQEGTLHVGDSFVCGTCTAASARWSTTRARIEEAGPVHARSRSSASAACPRPATCSSPSRTTRRRARSRSTAAASSASRDGEDRQGLARRPLHQIQSGDVKELKVVLKADVQGSVEAADALR